jgi:DNA-binding transcriptional ArsR family regulator
MNADELTAELFAALAHPNRLRIVEFLRDDERCSCEIQPALGIEQSNLSRHIKILVTAGILRSRKDGLKMMLRIADPAVFEIIETVKHMLNTTHKARSRALARA